MMGDTPAASRPLWARLTLVPVIILAALGVVHLWWLWPLALLPALAAAGLGSRSQAISGGIISALMLILAAIGTPGLVPSLLTAAVLLAPILFVVSLERMRTERRLARTAQSSMTDRLTGLYNFSYFKDQIRRECRRAERDGRELSLVLIDIDHFKRFNDTHGHASGNHLLAAVAAEIHSCARGGDCAARYGGEEFVVIVDGDGESALALAKRINRNVAAIRTSTLGGRVVSTTVSCGVASYAGGGQEELIEEADRALYAAKAAGRNCVRRYGYADEVGTPPAV